MNLNQLTTFVTVITEGSMTAAGDKLLLTQPAVSQQIRNLEEDLGVHLLVRGVRQIKTTPQGELLYEQAKKIIQLAQNIEISIKTVGTDIKGYLRIGTLNSIGLQFITPVLNRFLRHYPKVKTKVEYDKGENLIRSYKKNNLDIIILPDLHKEFNLELEGTEKRFLLKEEMWLVSSNKSLDDQSEIEFRDICQMPFISMGNEYPGFANELRAMVEKEGITLDTVFESENVGTLKRAIESGIGWGFAPAHALKKQVRAGRLNRIHVKDFSYVVDLQYYHRNTPEIRSLANNFYQVLTAERG